MSNQKTIRILIAEDDYLVGKSTAALLRTMGYTVVGHALDGREAVEMTQSLRPDVILMDIKMPVMDGIEATRHIYETCPTPVVALTAYATPAVIERAIAAGVGAYLTKPASPQEMERAINITIARFDDMVELRRLNTELQAEITERKRAEEELRESEARYRTLFEQANDAIFLNREDDTIVDVNRRACEMLGYTREQLLTMKVPNLQAPEVRGREGSVIRKELEYGGAPFETVDIHRDGTRIPVEVSTSRRIGREEGLVLSIVRDITERKRAEEEIKRRNKELAALNAIAAAVSQSLELKEILGAALKETLAVLNAEGGLIYLFDETSQTFATAVHRGLSQDVLRELTGFKMGEGLSGRVAESGEPLVVADLAADPRNISPASVRGGWHAYAGVPINYKESALGVMTLASRKEGYFRPDHVGLLSHIGNQIGVAIENARLYEETKQRALEQETLREAALALTTALDRNRVIERILAQLQQVVPYDSASIQLLQGDMLVLIAGRGFPNLEQLLGTSFPASGDNPNREVIRTLSPSILEDAPVLYEAFTQEPFAAMGIRSWLGVPMLIGERLVGMITLDKREPGFYTQEHARLVEAFAAQAAVAIENARLFEETQQRVAELEVLRRTSLQLTSSLDLADVLDSIAENALSLVGATDCHLYLYDETSETFTFGTALWQNGRRDAAVKTPRRDGLTATVAREGQAIIINDATQHPLYASPEARKWGLQAIAGFPLKRAGRVLGVFNITFLEPHTFSREELRVLGLLTDQAAIAIENARLHTETQRRLREQIILRKAGAAISSALDPETVLTRIAEQMGRAIDATSAYFCSYEPGTKMYIVLAEYFSPQACDREQVSDLGVTFQDEDEFTETLKAGQYSIDHIDDPDLTESERAYMQQYRAQTILYISLQVKGQLIGYAEIWESRRRREFTTEEITLCQDIAQQAAVAMENARLFTEAEQRATELSTMLEAARAVSSTLDLRQVLALIAEQMTKAIGVAGCTLSRWDREADAIVTLTEWRQRRTESADEPGASYDLDDYPATRAVLEKRQPNTFLATDPDAEPTEVALMQQAGVVSLLMLPLVVGERVIGLVELDETEREREFTDAEIQLCQALADQVAVAIENARLYEEEKRRRTQLALINEVGEKAASILDSDRLMQEVTRSIQESFNYYNVALLLLDEERQEMMMEAIAGGFEHVAPDEYRQSIDQGIAGFVARTGESRLVNDVSKDPYYIRGVSSLEEVLTESELCVPIKQGNEVIGVLDMQSVHLNDFEQADVVVMEAVANRIAVALENARLFEEEKRRNAQLALINEVGEKAASILDSDRLMQEVTRSIQESFNYYNVALLLSDEERREMVIQAVAGGFEHIAAGQYRQSLDEGIIGFVARTGKSWLAGDVSKDPYYTKGFLEEILTESELCVPIKLGNKVIGVLDMQSVHLNAFDQADVVVMEAVADRVAIGIQNARLYEEMAGLYDVGLAVSSTLELDKTLGAIYEQVNRLMSSDTFYIALYDEARGELRFDVFVEEGEWLPKFTRKLDEGGMTTWIVQSRKPLFIGDFEKESPPVTPGQAGKPETETQSWLGFPLLVRDKVVGVISVQSFRSHAFTEGNKRTLSAFANQAAIAIENARLYEETRQRALEQETLREAALALTTTLDRNEVIDRILIQLQQVVPYDSASVQLLQGDRLVIIGGHGFPSLDELLGISFPTDGDNPNREVMRTRASFIVEDAPVVYEAFREDPHRQMAICSWLGVPMLIGEQLVGMIALDKREPGFYTQEHARLAEAFAAQGAIAIENARLFEETRRRALQLQTIEEIGRRVSAILNPDELLPYVARAIQRSFGYYHVDIFLIDTATSYVVFKASSDPARKKAWKEQGLRFKIGEEGITGWVAHTGEPLLVNDVSQEPRYLPDELLPETKSELVVPLKVGERVVGVLDVASNELNAFAEDNLFVLQTLSNQIAIAIENARLFQETEERRVYLEGVLGAAPDAIVTLDAHHRVVEWNAGAEKLFGYSPEEVIGKDTDDLITSPDVLEEAVGFTQIGLSGREMPPTEVVRYRKDGSPVDVLLAGSPILVGDELIGTVVVYTDITEQVRAEREIEERRVYLEGVLREAPDAIVTLDAHHRIVEWNTGAERLFGYSRGETIGRDLDPLITNPDVFEEAIGFTQMALGGKALPPTETVRYRKDGSPVDVLVAASPIMVGDELIGIVAVYTDITERVRMEETLRALALVDDLTDLYNRRGFVTLGQQQLKTAQRARRRMVLLFADLDGLKQINDAFGHPEGDRALIEVANALRETFRESDIVARIGGDEFVVLAIETNGSPAEVLATRLQEDLKARNAREDRHYKLSLSMGLARYDPEHPCSIDELLAQADRAMYEQKRDDTSE